METSQNLAAEVVNQACQEFQQFVDQQAALTPIAENNNKWLKIWIKIAKFATLLLILSVLAWLISITQIDDNKKLFTLIMNITLVLMVLNMITLLPTILLYGERRLYQKTSQKIAAGRLSHVKNNINLALIEHICANEDDSTADFYFKRMKEISGGFFAADFESQLEPEEVSEIRNWLRANYSACLRAD
ncbi:hypothetical protein EOM71_00040 [Candidatus Falkowbacteria bacterium]|nr:hypothetical protein [Candidatus Falkowbacteria bacterium]